MVLKNEARQIVPCLEEILPCFEQVVILDHGSTDGTPDVIRETFGIEVADAPDVDDRDVLRNESFDRAPTDWILRLDADERVDAASLEAIRSLDETQEAAGFFTPWTTYRPGASPMIDYKLTLFRNPIRAKGLVHEGMQTDIRDRGWRADWLPELPVRHYPEAAKDPVREENYGALLERGIAEQPTWVRYHWFLGLTRLFAGRIDAAGFFETAARARSTRFPVECLNSAQALAKIRASRGDADGVAELVTDALSFHDEVAGDFEVELNAHLRPWFEVAARFVADGTLERIAADEVPV